MVDLRWDGDDFRNEQSSSGTTADQISHTGKLQQGYRHGSLTQGLVAYYPMEKGQGETLHDSALNNLGQINGANWEPDSQFGNYSLKFDGDDDYIDISSVKSHENRAFTISMWAKRDSNVNKKDPNTYGASDGGNSPYFQFQVGKDTYAGEAFVRLNDGSNKASVLGSTDLRDDQWHHILFVQRSTSKRLLYVDGVKEGSDSSSISVLNTKYTEIGRLNGYGQYFPGNIGNIRVYNRALSKPEIQALYNLSQPSGTQLTEKQVPGQEQGGVSRYKFNGDVNDGWGSNDGTDSTDAGFVAGVYGQAKDFNGNADYVSIPELPSLSSFTISVWGRPDAWSNSNQHYLLDIRANNFITIDAQSDGTKFRTGVRDELGSFKAARFGNPELGDWYHWVSVWDGSELRAYTNGSLQDTVSVSSMENPGNSDMIGDRHDHDSDREWDGAIDDVRIYNTALTPRQIEKLYHKGAYRIPRESTLQ